MLGSISVVSTFESVLQTVVCVVEGGNNCTASGAYHLTDTTGGCTAGEVLVVGCSNDDAPPEQAAKFVQQESCDHSIKCGQEVGHGNISDETTVNMKVIIINGHKNSNIDQAVIEFAIDAKLVADAHIECSIHGPDLAGFVDQVVCAFVGVEVSSCIAPLISSVDQCCEASVCIETQLGHLSDLILDGRQCSNSVVVPSLKAISDVNGNAASAEFGQKVEAAKQEVLNNNGGNNNGNENNNGLNNGLNIGNNQNNVGLNNQNNGNKKLSMLKNVLKVNGKSVNLGVDASAPVGTIASPSVVGVVSVIVCKTSCYQERPSIYASINLYSSAGPLSWRGVNIVPGSRCSCSPLSETLELRPIYTVFLSRGVVE